MRKLVIFGVLIGVPVLILQNHNASVPSVQLAGSFLALALLLGILMAFRSFFGWHMRFHQRMRDRGLW